MLSRTLSLSLTLASTLLCSLPLSPAIAQGRSDYRQLNFNEQPGSSVGFMPTDRRLPIRTASGGRRGACAATDATVVPLLPRNGGALSATSNPSFWVYVPAEVQGTAHFRLTDESQGDFEHRSVRLPQSGGLVKVELSKGGKELEAGHTYQWFFSVECAVAEDDDEFLDAQQSRETFVTGWVRYEPLNPSDQAALASSSSLEQAITFAQLGYWHDSLDRVASLQQSGDGDTALQAAWDRLLASAGLEAQPDGAITTRDGLISLR